MQVCFLAHIVQLLLTYEEQADDADMEVEEGSDKGSEAGDGPWLISLMAHCRTMANIPHVKAHPQLLLDFVKENRFVRLENLLRDISNYIYEGLVCALSIYKLYCNLQFWLFQIQSLFPTSVFLTVDKLQQKHFFCVITLLYIPGLMTNL